MRSRTLQLSVRPCPTDLLLAATEAAGGREPDLALAFLPPDEELRSTLRAMASAWPGSLRLGCEAVTQFAGEETVTGGTIQLFWLERPGHRFEVEVVPGTHGEPPPARRVELVARRLAGADGALVLADGLRFPIERFLGDLRRSLPEGPPMAGGLASQSTPVTRSGARVFLGDRVLPSACLAVTLHGVDLGIEVLRGWTPASPIYKVTRASGNVLYEIDGEPATAWYRRFFTVGGQLAPMPETAHRFPLTLVGPAPERQGLYRSLRTFDDPPGAITFWGNLEAGDQIRLGMGSPLSLLEATSGLRASPPPDAAILYSCAARQAMLGEGLGQEASAVHRVLGEVPLSGFFTFGEIGPTGSGGAAHYNHVGMLMLLREAEP